MDDASLLDRLSEADRRAVIQTAVRRRYRKGDTVFHAGDQGDSMHLIAKGRVAIQVVTLTGDTATLNVLRVGETFGELALLSGALRSASVVALEPLETLALSSRDVNDLREANPAVQRFLIEVLADQVARLTRLVMEAHFVSAEQRVVRRLADATRLFADAPDERSRTVPLTQEQLAGMAGTTRPTANRVLQDLVGLGIVAIGRGRVEILDQHALDLRAAAG
ncbi:MAG: Crp/Fnr family transcriptional regulator [Ilumatobacteraceae bacterium]|nr:Crp/Fnr family transcriptional regulator [Ilumatobacteraceae bacterium]